MENNRSIEVSAANGYRYQFVEGLFGRVHTYFWDKWRNDWTHSCKDFNSFDDAIAWADSFGKTDEKESKALDINWDDIEIPADYYGVPGRYYGD